MTLEEWISDVKSMVEENKILIEHTVDPFEKRFRQKQLEISSEKLELLEELQRYRKNEDN